MEVQSGFKVIKEIVGVVRERTLRLLGKRLFLPLLLFFIFKKLILVPLPHQSVEILQSIVFDIIVLPVSIRLLSGHQL